MKNQLLPLLFLMVSLGLSAQNSFVLQRTISWANTPATYTLADGTPFEVWKFKGCSYGDDARSLPLFSERFAVSGKSSIEVEVVSVQWEPLAKKASADDIFLSNTLEIKTLMEHERNQFFGRIKFVPLRKAGNGFERAVAFNRV